MEIDKRYELKRMNRATVVFPKELKIPEFVLQSVTRPQYTVYDGWSPIKIKLYDPIGPSTSQAIHELILKQREDGISEDEMFEMNIQALDPPGEVVEDWLVKVRYVEEVDFGTMTNKSDKPVIITLRLVVKDAVLLY